MTNKKNKNKIMETEDLIKKRNNVASRLRRLIEIYDRIEAPCDEVRKDLQQCAEAGYYELERLYYRYQSKFKGIESVLGVKEQEYRLIDVSLMREFDLEKAKSGQSVCTFTGRPARIVCFDSKTHGGLCMVVLVEREDYEEVVRYDFNGKDLRSSSTRRKLMLIETNNK
jgi:hypothetical protein